MTDSRRNVGGDDDDEEEEGMLKVDEEGQIEDDGANHQVSHSRPSTEGRSISLADRLMPLPETSPKKPSGGISNSSTSNGYVSPRHANLERERDRDRFLETSPGPSSYAPPRSRFGYPPETSASYGSSSAYPYPPNHRDPLRAEPYASGSRTAAPRTENRRGWYPPSTAARGPDTYRPGAIRDRERERERDRDWDAFRDGDRDRDWSALDRDRGDRDGYRDMADKRRDWPPRERSAASSTTYDVADSHSAYPPSTSSKYGFDNRDFPGRRPASPPAHLGRERDFDADRSRDRDRDRPSERDQRIRAPSSGWGSGMRQWGKPSDAGWDSRSVRRPASEDARSDTSHRQSGSRSNNTPPPAASSESGAKPTGSDQASERSEVRSREMSPHPARFTERGVASDSTARERPTEQKAVKEEAKDPEQKPNEPTQGDQQINPEVKTESADAQLGANAEPAHEAAEGAGGDSKSASVTVDTAEGKVTEDPEAPPRSPAHEAIEAGSTKQDTVNEGSVQPRQPTPDEVQANATIAEATKDAEKEQSEQTPRPSSPSPRASSSTAAQAESVIEAAPLDQPVSKEENLAEPVVAEQKEESKGTGAEEQNGPTTKQEIPAVAVAAAEPEAEAKPKAEPEASPQATAPLPDNAASATEDKDQSASVNHQTTAIAESAIEAPRPSVTEDANDAMDVEPAQPTESSASAKEQVEEVSPSQPAVSSSDNIESEARDGNKVSVYSKDDAAVSKVDQEPMDTVAARTESPESPHGEPRASVIIDVDMPDAAPGLEGSAQEATTVETTEGTAAAATTSEVPTDTAKTSAQEELSSSAAVYSASSKETRQPAASAVDATEIVHAQSAEVNANPKGAEDHAEPQKGVQPGETDSMTLLGKPAKSPAAAEAEKPVETETIGAGEPPTAQVLAAPVEAEIPTAEAIIKTEPDLAAPVTAPAMEELPVQAKAVDEAMDVNKPEVTTIQSGEAPVAEDAKMVDVSAESAIAPANAAIEPESDTTAATPSQIQVTGPYVTATIDKEKQTQEITLPHVDYGTDKEARALVQQENARIEEVEAPTADQTGPSLRIAKMDDSAKDIEPPLMTPITKEQIDQAILTAVSEHVTSSTGTQNDWKRILRENQRISQKTTMDVLNAKIHGIPQIVSSDQPLWLDSGDKQMERVKSQLYDQLLGRKKRLNDKIEGLKKRYRSINEEWKVHCSRLDRAAERREMLRRPPVNTPAGTPGAFGAEDPSSGAAGGGLLSASLTTGRANRRSAQAGFAGFGDAVRSEAEFLEILASLENADMQDPNMRAARTTATAPDMHIDPESDHLMKLEYDDINGFVADPLAFYLDEFDPDVWSEEEKAIFARRYALWPKQFGKIAQALPHKTPAQCVRYYYLNKKLPGNDFKALAAARNRERKRKARVKPKKAKGSALMADLKSAKGEEVDDVEDGSGMRSPMDPTDPSSSLADAAGPSNGRRGGRSRMVPAAVDNAAGASGEEVSVGRKRSADQTEAEAASSEAKAADKRRPGPKTKRAKSDNATGADKARKPRNSLKKDSAALEEAKADVPSVPSVPESAPKQEGSEPSASTGTGEGVASIGASTIPSEAKARVEDSAMAAAEALGALAGLFGGPAPGDANASDAAPSASSQLQADAEAASLQHLSNDLDADGRKVGKKRRSKTAGPGEEGVEAAGKGRGKQPTSSYWSVAERSEFLRALVVHGPRWEVVSSTLAQKSTAQARNYYARNESEPDFADAAALARSHADLPQAEREAAALAFVRQRFASNAATAVPSVPMAGGALPLSSMSTSGFGGDAAPRTTHLPPPPGITASQGEHAEVKVREDSSEPPVQRRGLQINSLLNDTSDAASSRTKRRSSLHEWQAEREAPTNAAMGRDNSVPPALYTRPVAELDRRPATADRIEVARPMSSDGRAMRDGRDERGRMYERPDVHRPPTDGREVREEGTDSRAWMYDSPYEAHRRPSPTPGYAAMAPPSHPVERGMPSSRYSMPPGSSSSTGHMGRPAPPMSTHLHPSEEAEMERERAAYGMYGNSDRAREHASHSMPPAVPSELRHASGGEQVSPTGASFGASHGYSRYAPPSTSSMYASNAASSTALAARGRPSNGPLTAPLPTTSDRPAYEQRWQRYSQSPGPSASSTPTASASHGASGVGGYSTGSAYRSSNSPYSSFPSQSLPRPSLPSLSASAGKVGAPHLPSLGAAGRSLPPILGTFPAPGRSMTPGSRSAGTGEEARYWPYPHRSRGHEPPPNRNQE